MSKRWQYLVSLESLLFSFCFGYTFCNVERIGEKGGGPTVSSCGALRSGHGVFAHRVGSVLVVLIIGESLRNSSKTKQRVKYKY